MDFIINSSISNGHKWYLFAVVFCYFYQLNYATFVISYKNQKRFYNTIVKYCQMW